MDDLLPGVLVALIFVARVIDVSLGTVRTILLVRGHAFLAAAIGFVEVLIWVTAAGQVLKQLDAWYLTLAYAGGFAAGNLVGVWLETRLAIGMELVRVVSGSSDVALAQALRDREYSIIELAGTGERGTAVEVVFVVEKRRRVGRLLDEIEKIDAEAFCTVSDIKRHVSAATLNMTRRQRRMTNLVRK